MASSEQVREYLAYWFQLGKPLVFNREEEYLPAPIFSCGRYSQDFEACWRRILAICGEGCYIKGTDVTVAMMLTSAWEIENCPRCPMPVLMPTAGICSSPCPCHDIPTWPNNDVPRPRRAVNNDSHLRGLRERLQSVGGQASLPPRRPYEPVDTAKTFSTWRGTS